MRCWEEYDINLRQVFLFASVNDDERTAKVLWEKYGIKVLPGSYLSQENHHTFYRENPGRNYIRIAGR